MNKITIKEIKARKSKEKLTCLTAYTYPTAKILDGICEIILVGDSLAMAIYGLQNTAQISLGTMIEHGKAVVKACEKSLVVVDIPAKTFENSASQALKTAIEISEKTNCAAVKIETDENEIDSIKLIAQNNINIMAHIGLLPQQVQELGGYKYQGRDQESARKLIRLAKQAEEAGAFAIVIEAVPAWLADEITASVSIPTIGIGASQNCDGQILVIDDLLGLNQEFTPKFVKKYENLAKKIEKAAKNYNFEVKNQIFPAEENLLKK